MQLVTCYAPFHKW